MSISRTNTTSSISSHSITRQRRKNLLTRIPKALLLMCKPMAAALIKEFEGWHSAKHYPYIGYGHKLLPHENLTADNYRSTGRFVSQSRPIGAIQVFPTVWERRLFLTILAYNVGHSRLLGYGKRPKSNLIKKTESGDRFFYEEYISYRCYKGKPIPSIERRRKREFQP